mmetsp:Transcript_37749/g.50112  ORF Transcript_37749/g.50112 Transcript_37749/m.50112 type:complete len:372 (+) Transcript_37749:250-1365(+)
MMTKNRNVKASTALLAAALMLSAGISSNGAAVSAFTTTTPLQRTAMVAGNRKSTTFVSQSSSSIQEKSLVLTDEEVSPIIRLKKGEKEKVVNAFGAWCAIVSILTGPPWALAMAIVNALADKYEDFDPNRAVYDYTGKVWSRVFLSLISSYPEITGDVKGLKERDGACLYVANHASWLDIPVICTVLDPVFKFISKAELSGVPCIGQQLTGGHHILIERDDRRSQLRTFKEGVKWLKSGVPLMAFPEGKRSQDGKLMDFKGGMFSLAVKVGVPVVPITLSNTHAVMPSNALFPVQSGGDGVLRVHVHDPIYPEGKTDSEIADEVRKAFMSKLPADQQPVEPVVVEEEEISEIVADAIISENNSTGKKVATS